MSNYPDYQVEPLENFYELFKRIEHFSEKIAFVNNGITHPYSDFCMDIEKLMTIFSSGGNYVLINLKDKYLFSVAYFATVLSGNIACLQPYSTEKLPCYSQFDFSCELVDEMVLETLNNIHFDAHRSKDFFRSNASIATVLCSSGTTSFPKAVALTQKNIISDLIAGMEKYQFPNNGVYVNIIPYSHAFGLVCDLLGPLYSASTIFLTYDPVSFFVGVASNNPTALNITPGLVEILLQRIEAIGDRDKVVGTRLNKILSGGAGTPAILCEKMALYNVNVCGCYGLSECAPCVCVNRDEYNKFGSAGIPLNCNMVSITPAGEIVIKGSNVMVGYLDIKGNIIDEMHGEYRTGDIGYLDNDGFLYVEGRVDDLIVFSNGNKLMPQTIEEMINKIDGVKESIVYLSENKLAVSMVVIDESFAENASSHILRNIFNGYKITKVNISTEPLSRNSLGKINRKNYGR